MTEPINETATAAMYRDHGRAAIEAAFRSLDGLTVDVGFQGRSGLERVLVEAPASPGGPYRPVGLGRITMVDLGGIHHFGAPAAKIPARPFLDLSDAQRRSIDSVSTLALRTAIAEKVTGPALLGKVAAKVGLRLQASVRKRITDLRTPALAPSTVRARFRKRGDATPNPLIDTGRMRASVSWQARKGGVRIGGDA